MGGAPHRVRIEFSINVDPDGLATWWRWRTNKPSTEFSVRDALKLVRAFVENHGVAAFEDTVEEARREEAG